jgi:DNA-binding MarR family transcriptional regulator
MSNPDAPASSLDDLYSKPGHLIRRCQQIAVAIFLEETSGFDVTSVQYAAMTAISHNPSIDATRLSQLVAFDRSTLGNVLLRLEQKKLIKRTEGVEDRRIKRIALTKAGHALLEEIEAAVERTQTKILEPLSPKEQQIFLELLTKLVNINNAYSRAPGAVSQRA